MLMPLKRKSWIKKKRNAFTSAAEINPFSIKNKNERFFFLITQTDNTEFSCNAKPQIRAYDICLVVCTYILRENCLQSYNTLRVTRFTEFFLLLYLCILVCVVDFTPLISFRNRQIGTSAVCIRFLSDCEMPFLKNLIRSTYNNG